MVGYEVWRYDDAAAIADLMGFEARCRRCAAATHVAGIMREPEMLEEALHQLATVNEVSYSEAAGLVRGALKLWEARNRVEWRTAVAAEMLERYPELAGLHEVVRLDAPDVPEQLQLFS